MKKAGFHAGLLHFRLLLLLALGVRVVGVLVRALRVLLCTRCVFLALGMVALAVMVGGGLKMGQVVGATNARGANDGNGARNSSREHDRQTGRHKKLILRIRFGSAINLVAMIWVAFISVILAIPDDLRAGKTIVGVAVALAAWYVGGERHRFRGPGFSKESNVRADAI